MDQTIPFSELLDKFYNDVELLKKQDLQFREKHNGYIIKNENKESLDKIYKLICDIDDSSRAILLKIISFTHFKNIEG